MSTVERPEACPIPALVAGESLDQPTFHERYAAMPWGTWAELVDGVVHMPSPLRSERGGADHVLAFWLMTYRRGTRGLSSGANSTVKLGPTSEVQPDAHLRIPEGRGGLSRIEAGFIVGPPELVIEIGRSSRAFDLGAKLRDYERAGAPEYLFVGLDPEEVRWHRLVDGHFELIAPDAEGVYRSVVFPGLWLDPSALFADDLDGLIGTLERGMATAEHRDFVEEWKLRKNRAKPG